jgi:hypothetical protein
VEPWCRGNIGRHSLSRISPPEYGSCGNGRGRRGERGADHLTIYLDSLPVGLRACCRSLRPVVYRRSQYQPDHWCSRRLATAFGTLVLAVVAIWGDQIRARLAVFGPRLVIEPLGLSRIVRQNNGKRARYYHLRIRNTRPGRFPPAHETRVFIIRVETEDAAGQPTLAFDERVQLTWAGQEVFTSLSRTIGPEEKANLLWVREDGWFQFETIGTPNHFPPSGIGRARFWVTVQARSNEMDSPSRRFSITWDGKWEDGDREIEKHLVVTPDPTPAA